MWTGGIAAGKTVPAQVIPEAVLELTKYLTKPPLSFSEDIAKGNSA
jgi:hypothetical protein